MNTLEKELLESETGTDPAYFWLALSNIPGVGNVIYGRLIERFGSPEGIFRVSAAELNTVEGIRKNTVDAIISFADDRGAQKELEKVRKSGATFLTLCDHRYPALLKTIYDPPPYLYVRGEIREEDSTAVAIVGSRNASAYGLSMTRRLARDLARQGLTIVSGLARGIDTAAHKGALEAGGRTIAVLGSGVDVVYPWENRRLAEEVAKNGAVISECPLGAQPEACNFPARNRIISGVSLGVVIMEASYRSGSLITARLALEQGREVFAVPGNVDAPGSKGTNRLIKEGAKVVTNLNDIIEEIVPQWQSAASSEEKVAVKVRSEDAGTEGRKILELFERSPIHIDELIQKTGLSSSTMASVLLDLELRGFVTQLPGKLFKRL